MIDIMDTASKPSKKKPIIVLVFAVVVIFLVISVAIIFFAKKPDVKTDTGAKTGQTINVGEEKLPDAFPKDFPIYPGVKVISSAGPLVTFTAPDGLDKVVPFYKNWLSTSGWVVTSSFDSDTIQTWEIAKGSAKGSISITTSQSDPLTIQVEFGNKE